MVREPFLEVKCTYMVKKGAIYEFSWEENWISLRNTKISNWGTITLCNIALLLFFEMEIKYELASYLLACSRAGAKNTQVEKPRVELRQFFPETWLFQLSEVGSPAQLDRLANQRLIVHCKYTVMYNAQHQNCWNNVQCSIFIAVFEALYREWHLWS